MSRTAALLIPGGLALMALLSVLALAIPSVSDLALIIIIIVALTATFATVSATISLRRVTESARRFADGDLTDEISESGPLLAGELVDVLNDMAARLGQRFEAHAQQRSRLEAALDSSIDAIVALDAEDQISFANSAAQRLLMRPRGDVMAKSLVWLLPNEAVADALRKAREGRRSEAEWLDRPNRRQLQVIATPIVGGGDWTVLAVFRDLTEIRRVEQVRRDFAANVSHELRTPLASIKSVIETLQAGALDDRAAAEDFLGRADLEVDRLTQMVEELLELSRIESGEVPLAQAPVDMNEVVIRAVARLQPQADKQAITLKAEAAAASPIVTGDADRLERAVVNLVHNAIKFTPPEGSVDVSVLSSDGDVTVSVTDSGTGIAPEDVPRIFERFYKADQARHGGGTGLGLAVVKHTVEAHGGVVAVQTEPGSGSTFTFTIPLAR